ncbi:GNAT family N-acetyltransferase [Streptomyces sp. NPDC090053]|uniref:GNAT family N-acetyltransferase n=1 Tax=Streptomyces sp. NPDC090053 TaxID=3365932 RepID=UPI00380E233B
MTTGIDIRHYTADQAPTLRPLLLDMYAEVYEDAAQSDPFASIDRYAAGLDGWSSRPGWSCVVGYDGDESVGYAYGAPLPEGARWWGGLLTDVPAEVVAETGTRTYALSELMVRRPWRKTGASHQLHTALLSARPEQRATLLVDQTHPKVHHLYENWGWQTLGDLRPRIENAPLFHAMLLPLHDAQWQRAVSPSSMDPGSD